MKKQVLTAALAGLLSASAIMTAFASSGGAVPTDTGTEVYAGIVLNDPDAKVNVTVPTLFAFVVNGSVNSGDAVALTDADILKPNLKVTIDEAGGSVWTSPAPDSHENYNYGYEYVGSQVMQFENRSTIAKDDPTETREGLAVEIKGSIVNEGTLAARNYWEHVANADALDTTAGFKKFTLEVAGIKFDSAAAGGGYAMSSGIALPAPNLGFTGSAFTNLDDTTGYAVNGFVRDADFKVYVGGLRNQYNQVEASAKVGTIVWTIDVAIENDGDTRTAPGHGILDQNGAETTP